MIAFDNLGLLATLEVYKLRATEGSEGFNALGLPMGTDEEFIVQRRFPVATIGIIVVNVVIYLLTSFRRGFVQIDDVTAYSLGFVPIFFVKEPLTYLYHIVTSMFLHAHIAHIFFNMLYLYVFGRAVENVVGSLRFLVLYLISGFVASLFHTVFSLLGGPVQLFIPAIGASGAISGILGSYLILFPGTSLTLCFWWWFFPLCFSMRASVYLVLWFALQVFNGYYSASIGGAGVAFFAHVGGFIAGIAALPIVIDEERHRYLRERADLFQRYLSYIKFGFYEYYERVRGLGPLTKLALVFLLVCVVAGATYIYLSTPSSTQYFLVSTKCIKIDAITGRNVSSASYVNVAVHPSGMGLASTFDDVRILMNRLLRIGILQDPDVVRSLEEKPRKMYVVVKGVRVPIYIEVSYAKIVDSAVVRVRGTLSTYPVVETVWGTYTLDRRFVYYYPYFDVVRETVGLGFVEVLAILCIAITSGAIYVALAKDRELTLVS